MNISIKNISSTSIAQADRIEKSEIEAIKSQVVDIQNRFKEEAGAYDQLVNNLRAWTKMHEKKEIIDDVVSVAREIRTEFRPEAFVTIGIGGSDLGSRTLHAQ